MTDRSNTSSTTRRRFLQGGAATAGAFGVAPLVAPRFAFAKSMPDPDKVLETIKPGNYVPEQYLEHFDVDPDALLWDPDKDWIRTADWEQIRSKFAGETVSFAVGAADAVSVKERLKPFQKLSGMTVEVVPIPDAAFYTKAVTAFVSGAAQFDALSYFAPWLGDFAEPGFLHELGSYVDKYKYPYQDVADTFWMNYGLYGDNGVFGIPYDGDFQMFMLRNEQFEEFTGQPASLKDTVKTWDDVIHYAKVLNKPDQGLSGIGYMGGRGFWSAYTWMHVAAQYGLELFDSDWKPQIAGDAGMKGLETLLELKKYAPPGIANWGWPEDRAAWLGGELAMNIAWQDQVNQATRRDMSRIAEDEPTGVYEPRGTGPNARFAPVNVAGSTASISANARNPEATFVMLSFFTTASLQALNAAAANGVSPAYWSVLNNDNFRKIFAPAKVLAEELPYAWAEPRIPGMYEMETTLGVELNAAITGAQKPETALQNASNRWHEIMRRNEFYSSNPPVDYSVIKNRLWLGRNKTPPV